MRLLLRRVTLSCVALTLILLFSMSTQSHAQSGIEWLPVGDPGNPGLPVIAIGQGSVPYLYDISKYEITYLQYLGMLNSVAAADPNVLWDTRMATDPDFGGINRDGDSGNYVYTLKLGFANRPVLYVNFWSAVRYANWLHNGKPVGSQDNSTTEDGAYTLTPETIADNSVTRNPDALYAIPRRDEWWKAGYYDPGTQTWFLSPAMNTVVMTCAIPASDDGNSANCNTVGGAVAYPVGSYSLSVSPNGTFDHGGNAREWVDRPVSGDREVLGGSWFASAANTNLNTFNHRRNASISEKLTGFRLVRLGATVPSAGPLWIGAMAVVLMGAGLRSLNRRFKPQR